MSFYSWKPYVPVAARREKAEKAAAKLAKAGAVLSPVRASRGAIAKTFWGRAWCENLERYSDYANRLPRGRTYMRNGSVIHLEIGEGEVRAKVVGSSLYTVTVRVAAVPGEHWRAVSAECATSIDSLVELLQGRFSKAVMERICNQGTGLLPAPRDIKLDCSCPDWAEMCKHVAAVLYGVGARLDQQPELLFRLRRVDPKELVAQAGSGLPRARRGPGAGKVLEAERIADVFGIEMDEGAVRAKVAAPGRSAARVKAATAPKAGVRAKAKVPAKSATLARIGKQPPAKITASAKKSRPSGRR